MADIIVQDKKGNKFSLPAAQLQQALRQGFTEVPKERGLVGNIIQMGIGAGKGLANTISGASTLGQKGAASLFDTFAPKIGDQIRGSVNATQNFRNTALAPTNTPQKIGGFLEQTAEFLTPLGLGGKAVKGAELASTAVKTAPSLMKTLTKLGSKVAPVIKDVAQQSTIAAAQEGDVNSTVGLTAGLTAAIPGLTGAVRAFGSPTRLMGKALGFTKSQVTKLSAAAKKAGYNGIEDFALTKGVQGSKEDIATQIDDLFETAISSKKDLLSNIKLSVKNKYDDLFTYLEGAYATNFKNPISQEIALLKNKAQLSAVELDRLRYLADKTLPTKAYSGAEPHKIELVQGIIDPVRKTLAGLDKSGTIRQANSEIQVLYGLIPAIANSQSSNLVNQILFRNLYRGGGAMMLGGAIPFTAP